MQIEEFRKRFLIEVKLDGTIMMSTPRATDALGYTYHELKSASIFDLISPDDVSEFRKELFCYIERRSPIEYLITKMLCKNGDMIYVIVTGVFIRAHGEPLYHLTFEDISDRFRKELELKKAKEEAELYLDLISHDIANLNQIGMGYLELVLGSMPLDKDMRKLLEKPMEVFKSTSQLINNVKKLRSVKEGGLKMERISLAEVLTSLKDEFTATPGREVAISYDLERDCHVLANGLIREVFLNLVGNAIKHSPPEKSLSICLRLDTVDLGNSTCCRVSIEDNGPGIEDDIKKKLQMRMNGSGINRERGVGLILAGLLVEGYRGKIMIEDRVPGDFRQGSRFVVLLPVALPSGP